MGTYLSSPVLDKNTECGEQLECEKCPVAWSCVDMQGWRKSMEDAHVSMVNISPPLRSPEEIRISDNDSGSIADNDEAQQVAVKLFAVFDGHGGQEVAKFSRKHIVSVLVETDAWKKGNIGEALVETFHKLDRMIDDPARGDELFALKTAQVVDMIDVPASLGVKDSNSPAKHPRRGQKEKFSKTAHKADDVTGDKLTLETNQLVEENSPENVQPSPAKIESLPENPKLENQTEESNNEVLMKDPCETPDFGTEGQEEVAVGQDSDTDNQSSLSCDNGASQNDVPLGNQDSESEGEHVSIDNTSQTLSSDEEGASNNDVAAPGKINHSPSEAVQIFHKFLSMSGANLKSLDRKEDGASFDPAASGSANENATGMIAIHDEKNDQLSNPLSSMRPTTTPTRVINGRQVCNLPDHPIHAGCTAIVVVFTDRHLTVANAGDSRAVLCRAGGTTTALSFDHKPFQDIEMSRITMAGGFVNQFGRVNGNLNLSRSIGDLKYKQTAGLPPSDQMITAEPDILQVQLEKDDEFIVIGCDGIWDCLTNEEAVKYVRDRIDIKTPTQIGIEMLNTIISKDPRATQGIGGDNMTILIVDLLPDKRQYRQPKREKLDGGVVEDQEEQQNEYTVVQDPT